MSRKPLRDWQTRCHGIIRESVIAALDAKMQPAVNIGACVGSGKSTMMVHTARDFVLGELSEILPLDFAIFVAPSRGIIGNHAMQDRQAFGLIGSLLEYGIWPIERITVDRMPGIATAPELNVSGPHILGMAAVFTYQYLLQPRVVDTITEWAKRGKRIGMFYDEIHHVPSEGTAWAEALGKVNSVASFVSGWSGTWFRTDERPIMGQDLANRNTLTFCYPYKDGIRDGHVRPVSFWIQKAVAQTFEGNSGALIDYRPVHEYLDEIPAHIRQEMFDPNGYFVEQMILRADQELTFRRLKYHDAGCLIVCPPGFVDDAASEDRIAERIYQRVLKLTGKRAMLILNGHPDSRLAEYIESDIEFVVAVNRISEGANIPRLRLALILRDIASEMLFEQIIGRVIRRRPQDDEEPALVVLPPIHSMCEFARRITIAKQDATPKKVPPCDVCGRLPCKCPCGRCGKQRPCGCPCRKCQQRPCICEEVPIDVFVALEEDGEDHIAHGTDIEDEYARRAGILRERVEACRSRDLANMAFIIQSDAQINGTLSTAPKDDQAADRSLLVQTAVNWQNLKNAIPVKVKKLQRFFPDADNPYQAAWLHINRRFFAGTRWKDVCNDPSKLTFDKLNEINTYLDRVTKGASL